MINKSVERRAFDSVVKSELRTPPSHVRKPGARSGYFTYHLTSADAHPKRQQLIAQDLGLNLSTGRPRLSFNLFAVVWPDTCRSNQWMGTFILSVSFR